MRLGDIQIEAKQVKAKSKKPKIVKPNKGGSSKHPYQGSLVGETSINTGSNPHKGKYQLKLQKDPKSEAHDVVVLQKHQVTSYSKLLQDKYPDAKVWAELIEANNKKPELPKQNNPVAKHSRNMPGAGAHKSAKDYDRKNKRKDINKQLDEAPLVMPYSAASDTALGHTAKWLQSHYSRKNDRRAEAYKKLGKLVGFEVQERGEDSIMFKRFFTQTENIKKIK